MPKSRNRVGRSTHYSSAVHSLGHQSSRTLMPALPKLNLQPFSRIDLAAWRPKISAVLLLVLLALGLYEFFSNEWFFVEHVEVQGLNILTQREVERASNALGYNIYFLEPVQVERAVSKMPEIKSAQVILGIPNSMLVQIEERAPEIVWFKNDEVYWVDADGIAFKARSPRADLPTIRDFDLTGVQPGKRVNPAAFNAIQALRKAWEQSPRNFEWSAANGLAAIDEHGWKIIFGDARDMDLKITKLKALVTRLVALGTRIKFIDLGKGEPFYQ